MGAGEVKEHTVTQPAALWDGRDDAHTTLSHARRECRTKQAGEKRCQVPLFYLFTLTRLDFNFRLGIRKQRRAAGARCVGDERDAEESRVTSGGKKQRAACGAYSE